MFLQAARQRGGKTPPRCLAAPSIARPKNAGNPRLLPHASAIMFFGRHLIHKIYSTTFLVVCVFLVDKGEKMFYNKITKKSVQFFGAVNANTRGCNIKNGSSVVSIA